MAAVRALAVLLVLLTACRPPAGQSAARSIGMRSGGGPPTTLHAAFGDSVPGGLQADVKISMGRGGLEYEVRILNPQGVDVRDAVVLPRGDTGGRPVALLFTEARRGEPVLQVRGTLAGPARDGAEAERLLSNPGDFLVVVRGGEPGRVWVGELRVGGK